MLVVCGHSIGRHIDVVSDEDDFLYCISFE